jgi:hypothetical protein
MNKLIYSGLACLLLAGCGGDSTLSGTAPSNGSSSSGTSGSSSSATVTLTMGNGSGSNFQPGTIAAGVNSLAAGGATGLQISIVDQNGALYSASSVSVTFNSNCIANGLSQITSAGSTTPAATVATSTGVLNVTYAAKGCSTADAITANAVVAGAQLSAMTTITVQPASIGSIQFISASPSNIGLKGTGLAETSTLVYQVVDSTGGPVPNVTVSFSLNTTVGGLSLSPLTAVSGNDGKVQTVVSAGTAHTSIRVTASIASPARATQSSVLVVTTGIPSSSAFSIAVGSPAGSSAPSCANVEAFDIDGVARAITVRLADRYNNPAPDGTAIAFTTDGGHVVGSCATPSASGAADGTCTVNWTSANPRPFPTQSLAPGRVRILATAIGEESFTDVNGNGFYDVGEPFSDLGEPYRNDNESAGYDSGEYFLDFNGSQTRDAGNGVFKGITCTGNTSADTCSTTTLAIGAEALIVMSRSEAVITANTTGPIATSSSIPIIINVKDTNNNPLAAGTKIDVTADSQIGTISSSASSFVIPCTTALGGSTYQSFLNTGSTGGTGNVNIKVTSPGGLITSGNLRLTVP